MTFHLPHHPPLRASCWALVLAIGFGLPAVLLGQVPAPEPAPAKVDPQVARLVESHNQERAKASLPPLTLEARLSEAAKVQAQDMAEHEFMGHEGTDKSTPAQRVGKVGYHYLSTGENVARGYRDVKQVMQAWMESPPHKKNIMGDFSEIGVAVVHGEDGKPYWCTEFARPIPILDPGTAASDLVKLINKERVEAKLPELSLDPKLAKAAREKAVNLARKKTEGGTPPNFDGIDQDAFQDLALSMAGGQPDAGAMLKALLGDPKLKSQILGKYARIGTGYATAEDGLPTWCLILANPARESRPARKSALKNR